jgi:hypothetical protein
MGYGHLDPEQQRLQRWSERMYEHRDDPDYSSDGSESFNDVLARVRHLKGELEPTHGEIPLLVTHGIFLRFFLFDSLLGGRLRPRAGEAHVAFAQRQLWAQRLRERRAPEEYFLGVEDQSIRDHLGERSIANEPPPRSPLWSRAAYDRYLEWALDVATTPNGVFGAKLM